MPVPTPLSIDIQAIQVLSYALAHNRIPVIGQIVLDGVAASVRGARVRVSIADAQGPLSQPFEALADLEAGEPTVLRDIGLQLDPGQMAQVEEQRPGTITVEVWRDDERLGGAAAPVQVLAANQWLRTGAPVNDEILASFVMPNHPTVDQVLAEASVILDRETGSPSLNSYQAGEQRVDDLVQAVCRAAEARQIRYAEPPASWSDRGQKVRTPGEVFDSRLGTCLDLVLALAAVLEQAGVRPLLFLVEGHCFLGYWRIEASQQFILESDPSAIINLIDLRAIALVETTLLTAGHESPRFADLQRAPYVAWLTGAADKVQGIVDVYEARQNGIIALPAQVRTQDVVQVFEYRPAGPLPSTREQTDPEPARDRAARPAAPPRVQHWKNALLDLTLRNRLINFSERTSLTLSVPDGLLGTFEDVVNQPRAIALRARDAIDAIHAGRGVTSGWELPPDQRALLLTERHQIYCDVSGEAYAGRMRNLAYKARTIVEESGANNLYLALGSLVWSLDARPLRSPLVLIPVQLKAAARGGLYRVSLDESGASVPNYCLLEKLRQVHGLEVPDLAEPVDDGTGIDLDGALHAMRIALNQAGLPYRVEETAHLAILQFAKFRLWKDLDEHWSTFAENALVQHLIDSPNEPFVDPTSPQPVLTSTEPVLTSPTSVLTGGHRVDGAGPGAAPEHPPRDLDQLAADCPVAADSSQLAAVADAVAGRTFVLEGPPGTGKSQTITNLLTRAMAEGQRVLFVAEKRAALDVVRRRLDDVGMGAFSLDLHDKGSKPATVRAQIRAALDADLEVDPQGLAVAGERLRSARQSLARYAVNLHAENPAGLSYYSAHTSALALADVSSELVVPPHLVGERTGPDVVQSIRRGLVDLPDTAELVNPRPSHPWGFVALTDPGDVDVTALGQACRELDAAVSHLGSDHRFSAVLQAVRTVEELATAASIATAPRAQLWVLDDVRNSFWQPAVLEARQRTVDFAQRWQRELGPAFPTVLELPLADIHRQAEEAAASGFFGRKKRLRAVLALLGPALQPDAEVEPRDVPALTRQLLGIQAAAQALTAQVDQIPGLTLSRSWNPLRADAVAEVDDQSGWLQWAAAFVAADTPSAAGRALREFLATEQSMDAAGLATLSGLVEAAEQLARVSAATSDVLEPWSGTAGLLSTWESTAGARDLHDPQLLPARRWVSFLAALEPLRLAGFSQAWVALRQGAVRADEAVQAFDRGLATASSIERADATGLAAFDVVVHDKTIERFTSASGQVSEQLRSALPRALVDRRSFNSANETGRVGALRRELSKLRRGMSVRALVSRYGDLITQVMPCVLVSPDSLSRFFPARADLFDIVVFDEASQIRVADAIGALGRARSVVVVGDSKQMPPTSFGETTLDWGDGGDDDLLESLGVVEDEESILSECVQARVPRHWLSWHYRSQDESLIAFSNALYYEDRLSSFPSPHVSAVGPAVDGVGVSLVRVDGHFERTRGAGHRTNPAEAQRIVDEVRLRFDAGAAAVPSIGIVTFNVQQRTLIESLLRDCGDERVVEALELADEGLFVKNLENVQGDERDVIFFSTAFSVDKNGKLPLNFGPLNRDGGERRLNVAVTRARRQVIVFSSFDPEQLRSEETSSRGIKDLRAYLDMAATGPGVLASMVSRPRRPASVDRHREQVAAVLRERGLVVSTNVGLSDFRIDLSLALPAAPDQPRVAVLLDGPGWAGRGTVGDRDGLPVQVLSAMMRWPAVERVWLPAWLVDPEPIVQRLVAVAERPAPETQPETGSVPDVPVDDEEEGTEPDGDLSTGTEPTGDELRTLALPLELDPPDGAGEPFEWNEPGDALRFVPWAPQQVGSRNVLDRLPAAPAVAQVRAVALEIIEHEGPVHTDRLAKLVARSFDLTRVGGSRAQDILQTVPRDRWDTDGEPFAWPAGVDRAGWTGFRRQDSAAARPLEHVSLREISNAMTALVRDAAGMSVADLQRETVATFGGSRVTPGLKERLDQAQELALRTARIVRGADGLLTAAAQPLRKS